MSQVSVIRPLLAANPDLEVEEPEDDEGWERFETKLQDNLDPFDLEFKSITDELSGKKIYALVSQESQCCSEDSPCFS